MIEQLIEKLIADGKITREEIDREVAILQAEQPDTIGDVDSLKKRQDEAENTILFILDMTLGGM